jgi:hypothetical protein
MSSHLNIVPSYKKCEKKLKEIYYLKQKSHLNKEELEKVKMETHYKNIMNKEYLKLLEKIPDDVQVIILSYLDTNTRLNNLKIVYNGNFINQKLIKLPKSELNIKKLFAAFQYIKEVLSKYLHKNGEIYQKYKYYLSNDYGLGYTLTDLISDHCPNLRDYYFNTLIQLILDGIKRYSKMYQQTKCVNELFENEKKIIKLYLFISKL